MSRFYYPTFLPYLVRSLVCPSFPWENLGSCHQKLVRLYTTCVPQFPPFPPFLHQLLNTMHAPWAKLFFRQGKYNPISMNCHHLPHPLTRSLSDGVFKVSLPRPWPDWAPTSLVETSPCGLMVLWCRWAAADVTAAAGLGSAILGSGCSQSGNVLGPFCKKNPQHKNAVRIAPSMAGEGWGSLGMAERKPPVSTLLCRAGRVFWDKEGCVWSCKSHCDQDEFHAPASQVVEFVNMRGKKLRVLGLGKESSTWGWELPAPPSACTRVQPRVGVHARVCTYTGLSPSPCFGDGDSCGWAGSAVLKLP